ncbi:hypothetical protein [Nitratireductor thuwali]|uniref:Mur ligase n=1 Tax=Nitratireductor thuwali TaxID=2267699 RepID=A0ABY5MSB9_9HYPH|nr:hypothetical protein NTH_04268 [Nitratireductor thuwali]
MKPSHLTQLLARLRPTVQQEAAALPEPFPGYVLFFSISDGKKQAKVVTATGTDFAGTWKQGAGRARRAAAAERMVPRWVRVDWVESVEPVTWRELRERLRRTKRNYFRNGLSLDRQFKTAFLETELNANAMLYGGADVEHAVLNERNFQRYARRRHQLDTVEFVDAEQVYVFSARGTFTSDQSKDVVLLHGAGPDASRRVLDRLEPGDVRSLIRRGSDYLATQVGPEGRFIYGWHPCFDRPINAYNSLRHASTLYAMLEAWEVTGDAKLKAAIDRSLDYLTGTMIRLVELAPSRMAAFLIDEGDEIKLGGNAVCLLALVKYNELTGTDRYLGLLDQLASGILHMQDAVSGRFSHVLNYPSLTVKEDFRIIYYDGEAAFGLMRLYGLTGDGRWLAAVERAFEHFIAAQHWKVHDHWLSYCVNELTLYRPLERYYAFGIRNFLDHLDFVLNRITTFPTLLELMMAAECMIARLQRQPELKHLLADVDLDKFYRALHARAHHLLNGHFWPELSMFFANPDRITGSFFIRHHAFRVRIDDVEHYLSGFVAYLRFLEANHAHSPT